MELLILIPIILFLIGQVFSNCHLTLSYYYDCKLYSVYPSKSKYRKYDFKNLSNDAFFNKTLNKIDTFPKAMSHFRMIFNEINTCNQTWCDCARHHIYDGPDYAFFFNSSLLYPQMVSILNTVKTKYTLMSFDQIAVHGFDLDEFYKGFPFLNEFCLKYDFSYEMFFYYEETFDCEMAAFDASHKCMASYFILRYLLDNSLFSSLSTQNFVYSQIEQYLSCLSTYMPASICPRDVKIGVLLTYLYDYPKVIRGSNLTTFINSIADKQAPIKTHVYVMENFVTSIKNDRQKCSFDKKAYTFFNSSWLKITGNYKFNNIKVVFSIYNRLKKETQSKIMGHLSSTMQVLNSFIIEI